MYFIREGYANITPIYIEKSIPTERKEMKFVTEYQKLMAKEKLVCLRKGCDFEVEGPIKIIHPKCIAHSKKTKHEFYKSIETQKQGEHRVRAFYAAKAIQRNEIPGEVFRERKMYDTAKKIFSKF